MELFNQTILDYVAVIILIMILIYSKTQFSDEFAANKLFNLLVYSSLIFTVFDLFSTYSVAYDEILPVWLNYFNLTVYFLADGAILISFYKYVEKYINATLNRSVAYYVISYFPILFAVECLIANFFVFILFEFDKYGFHSYGPLFPMFYFILVYYYILVSIMLFKNRQRISKRQIRAVVYYMITTILIMLIQIIILPNYSLQTFGFAIAMLVLMLTLETPDYQKLNSTLKSLEAAREQANKLADLKPFFVAGDKSLVTPVEYNYRKCIEDIYYSFRHQAVEKRIAYSIETDDTIPDKLIGDRVLLKRILTDFLSNVIANTKRGELILKSTAENLTPNSLDVVISVLDSNINMSLEHFSLRSNGIELTAGKNSDGFYVLSCRIPHIYNA